MKPLTVMCSSALQTDHVKPPKWSAYVSSNITASYRHDASCNHHSSKMYLLISCLAELYIVLYIYISIYIERHRESKSAIYVSWVRNIAFILSFHPVPSFPLILLSCMIFRGPEPHCLTLSPLTYSSRSRTFLEGVEISLSASNWVTTICGQGDQGRWCTVVSPWEEALLTSSCPSHASWVFPVARIKPKAEERKWEEKEGL